MFCPKCGNQLPDNAQFCASCGARIAPAPTTGAPGGAARVTSRHPRKKPLIVAAAVVVVAVVGVVVAFATGLLGGPRVPNGTISINGLMYFQFERQGSDAYVTVGGAYGDGDKSPFVRGRLVRDGSNEDGTVWRLEDATVPDGGTLWDYYRLQFPDGAADGKLVGAWKFSYGYDDPEDNDYAYSTLANFSDDGGAWILTVSGGLDLTQQHYSYDDAVALSQSVDGANLGDGMTWWPNGDNYQLGMSGYDYSYDITFDLS